jgi:hypothetical protein
MWISEFADKKNADNEVYLYFLCLKFYRINGLESVAAKSDLSSWKKIKEMKKNSFHFQFNFVCNIFVNIVKLCYNEQLGTVNFCSLQLGFVITVLISVLKWPAWPKNLSVITEFVITEFHCNWLSAQNITSGKSVFSGIRVVKKTFWIFVYIWQSKR